MPPKNKHKDKKPSPSDDDVQPMDTSEDERSGQPALPNIASTATILLSRLTGLLRMRFL
jgi:hypothetical protein